MTKTVSTHFHHLRVCETNTRSTAWDPRDDCLLLLFLATWTVTLPCASWRSSKRALSLSPRPMNSQWNYDSMSLLSNASSTIIGRSTRSLSLRIQRTVPYMLDSSTFLCQASVARFNVGNSSLHSKR